MIVAAIWGGITFAAAILTGYSKIRTARTLRNTQPKENGK